MAAVLPCGQGTVLSQRAAASRWQLRPLRGPRVDVTVTTPGGGRRHKLVIVHRSPLAPEDVTVKDAIPVTTPARTVVDLADISTERELERTLDEAAYLGLDLAGLKPLPGRRGSGRLARVLAHHQPGTTLTRSDLEERMLQLCRRHLLPRLRLNTPVDGHRAHGRRAAFEHDRWRVVRITPASSSSTPTRPRSSWPRCSSDPYPRGSSSSLPLVLRACMSSWARRTSESG
jgi:hypothetical protein